MTNLMSAPLPLPSPGAARIQPGQATAMPIHSQPYFHQELAALRKLERIIWPQGPVCPHCGASERIGAVTGKGARPGLKFCCRCRKQFRATIGTLFEGSHVPLHKWLQTCLLLTAPGDGISAHRLHRHLGVTYKTALWMVRRLAPVVADAMAELDPGPAAAAPAGGRRRIRWHRRNHGERRLEPARGLPEDDEPAVPWAYPAAAAQQGFQEFAEIALGLGCCAAEEAFDAILRKVTAPARPRRAAARAGLGHAGAGAQKPAPALLQPPLAPER